MQSADDLAVQTGTPVSNHRNQMVQLPLFTEEPGGRLAALPGGVPSLTPESSLAVARFWFRRSLTEARRPVNTIDSYGYDLALLETMSGCKMVSAVSAPDIAAYLGDAGNLATRKRRLTSARAFFTFLVREARVIEDDPSLGFFPHAIPLKTPEPLFRAGQDNLLAAAARDVPWALLAVWLMLRLGVTRGELLELRRESIDMSDENQPVVHIIDAGLTKPSKERRLAADDSFARIYTAFLNASEPLDRLFPYGFQAINGMVERVRRQAGITRVVTPQTLRHTFAVDQAKLGVAPPALLALLGLADEPRNRASLDRYYDLARPPLQPAALDSPSVESE